MTLTIDWQSAGTILAALTALVGMLWQYFVIITEIKKDVSDLGTALRAESVIAFKGISEALLSQSDRLARLETKTELFWNAVGGAMSSLIKQPIHFRKDELMDKLFSEQLPKLGESTIEELVELRQILKDELVTLREIKDPKSLAYALVMAYINQLFLDKGRKDLIGN